MINYQYTETPYVDPVNLEILGKTYDTLEEGHHKAVEAESALKAQIANLPLNEAEDGFKQALLNDLNTTIEENTRFGNKYSALDDIVRVNGDISTNPGLIGRLKAQEDYMAFQDALDKAEIPDAYKEMYRELNPYSYQDKYDKDGNVIGGTKWTPTSRPVKTIDLSDIITKGISWASVEAGESTVTRWLDENGQLTTDPTKAFDGEYYDTTTNSWQRLGRDKILDGIQAAIESTPGAKESLEQDYKFAEWKHNKLVKESNGRLVISDITDERGMKLTPQEYLMKRIDPAVYAKEYYISTTKTTYGDGLATYKKAQAAAIAAANSNNLEAVTEAMPLSYGADPGSEAMANKTTSINKINQIVEQVTGENPMLKLNGTDKIGNRFDNILNDPTVDPETKYMLNQYILVHDEAVTNLSNWMKDMGDDKDLFEFATRMESGGQLVAGATEYDDEMLRMLSSLQDANGNIIIKLDEDDRIREDIVNVLNGGEYEGYKNLGIEFTNEGIIIPKNSIGNAPMIMSIVRNAQAQRNKGFIPTLLSLVQPYDYEVVNEYGILETDDRYFFENTVRKIGKRYDKLLKQKDKLYEKYMPSASNITTSTLLYSGGTWDQKELLRRYNLGQLTKEQFDRYNKDIENTKHDFIMNHTYAQSDIYAIDKKSNTLVRVVDSNDRDKIGSLIVQVYQKSGSDVDFTPAIAEGLTDKNGNPVIGYYLSFIDDKLIDDKYSGSNGMHTYFIPGFIHDEIKQQIERDPKVRANTSLKNIGNQKQYKDLSIDTGLRGTSITGESSDIFTIKFKGVTRTVDKPTASKFLTAINTISDIKNMVAYGIPIDKRQTKLLNESILAISQCVDLTTTSVEQEIGRLINQYYNK